MTTDQPFRKIFSDVATGKKMYELLNSGADLPIAGAACRRAMVALTPGVGAQMFDDGKAAFREGRRLKVIRRPRGARLQSREYSGPSSPADWQSRYDGTRQPERGREVRRHVSMPIVAHPGFLRTSWRW